MIYKVKIYDKTFTFVIESEEQEIALRDLIERMKWEIISVE